MLRKLFGVKLKIDLNGPWKYIADINDEGVKNEWFRFDCLEKNSKLNQFFLPNSWNNIEENGELIYDRYEGIMWFLKEFDLDKNIENEDYILQFNGANYLSMVWFNDSYLGKNEGGFLPFKFKINDLIKQGKNHVIVRVDNIRREAGIPGKSTDWYNWGGIYRDIFLDVLPRNRVEQIKIKTTKLENDTASIEFSFKSTNPFYFDWEIIFNDETITRGQIKEGNHKGVVEIKISNPNLWNPEHPHLYDLKISSRDGEYFKICKFGIRLIEIKNGFLYINKKLVNLKGISLHEELMPYGRTIPLEERKRDIISMKNFGFNALRSSHYSHDESLIELTDKFGMYMLEEIPIYWNINFKDPRVLKLAVQMIRTLIDRDYNHPSVIMWSLGNEIPAENKHCRHVLKHLYKVAKTLDDSRIITHVSSRFWGDPLRKHSDVVCVNEYFGWYMFSERVANFVLDLIRSTAPNKPWFITEFGAGAKFGFRSRAHEKFSEEKQASIISHSIVTFNAKKFIQGYFIWIYRDFRSPLRRNKYQQGFNRKGIVSEKNEPKLIAKIHSKIKDKRVKKRNFSLVAPFSKLIGYYVEQFLYDLVISKVMHFFEKLIIKKYYVKVPRRKNN